ncbi:MAG: cell division protein SepF [Ruminococcaceae bacterium]|nr:cell division protein SepF [Oscillospiraceae bacterium]
MNLLKRFVRNDNADFDESYDENELYVMPEDIQIPDDTANSVSALENPARKDPEFRPVSAADKVSLKLLQPKSHIEATRIADKLKDGCIVLLDISRLTKEQAHRLVDFLSGVAYVLGGEMIRTNKNTIVISPSGVDISGFAPDVEAPAEPQPVQAAPAQETSGLTEEYEEEA